MMFDYIAPAAHELRPVEACGRVRLYKGGSSSSSASSSTTNATDNRIVNDSGLIATGGSTLVRDDSLSFNMAVDDSSIKTSNSNNDNSLNFQNNDSRVTNTNVTATDFGSVQGGISAAMAAVNSATSGATSLLKSADFQTATVMNTLSDGLSDGLSSAYGGYSQLLSTSSKLLQQSADNQTTMASGFTSAVNKAYDNASAAASGTIDNRTIMVLGVAAAAVAAVVVFKKG